MTQSLAGLFDAMKHSLQSDVQGELTGDYARSQLAGVLDILSKVERMVVWSPDALRDRLRAIDDGCAAIEQMSRSSGYAAPAACSGAPDGRWTQVDLEQAVREGEQRLATFADWLFAPTSELPAALRRELDGRLRKTLGTALAVERKFVARADFSSMTGAAPTESADNAKDHRP